MIRPLFFGILLSVAIVFFTILLEGGRLLSFLQISSILLIVLGSLGVTMASFTREELFQCLKDLGNVITPPDDRNLIPEFERYWDRARKDGLLSLEEEVGNMPENFLQKSLQLVVDGTDPNMIEQILTEMSDELEKREFVSAKVFETAGGFAPTLGIIGTVLGLVHVLENLNTGTAALGKGIAIAFIATFYGIGFANLLFIPIGNQIRSRARRNASYREAIVKGVLSLQNGDSKRILREKMETYL